MMLRLTIKITYKMYMCIKRLYLAEFGILIVKLKLTCIYQDFLQLYQYIFLYLSCLIFQVLHNVVDNYEYFNIINLFKFFLCLSRMDMNASAVYQVVILPLAIQHPLTKYKNYNVD